MFRIPTKERKWNAHFIGASSVCTVSLDDPSSIFLNLSWVTSWMFLVLHNVCGKNHDSFYLLLCPAISWFRTTFEFKDYFQSKEVSWLWRVMFYLLFSNTSPWQLSFRRLDRKCIPELPQELSNPGLQRKKQRRRCGVL